MPHRARSKDLNPNGHFRDVTQRQLNQMKQRPRTAIQLGASITQIYSAIQNGQINRPVSSINNGHTAVIAAREGTHAADFSSQGQGQGEH